MLKINAKFCDGCGTCVAVCPKCAITMPNRAEINAKICVKCALCAKICPIGAIEKESDADTN